MDIITIVLFVLGLALLIVGAEGLVRGASRMALGLGVSPLVVGLTVVAFGTSAPELAVSIQSALAGPNGADVALGNVVGSNIANVLLILGISAVITPLVVQQQLIRLDVPLMIGVSALVFIMAMDGVINRIDGLILFSGIVIYTVFAIRQSRKESAEVQQEYRSEFDTGKPQSVGDWIKNILLLIGGLALLVLGARWLVDGAISVARAFGISELVIGLTIVAVGTSLPEIATSIIAALRGERDIAVGNVVGSNIFNLLSVLGLSSIVAPVGVNVAPAALNFDLPVMLAVAVACLPIFFTGRLIARWEGWLFLGYYIAYTLYLILAATQHEALPAFSTVMGLFVLPLTALTLLFLAWRAFHAERRTVAS
ncbi:calcium/sodium antiporter [Roseiflexus castenholzii]|jgi:cation:H+ antiporter|uniref:Na+/Ca+ antiporter, CaCA family n=1 Tax=Roseiflexus castenholzii (strain DSM 13941 / HLO8) TaxID=383372 RepID=A7NQZ1_ROSCS|nr:Na+/Ca+ antiporter, CaCA family [Roseiflexus castenholzii DSM 13941]